MGDIGKRKRRPGPFAYPRENTPTRVIALKTGRTADVIYTKASELGVPLKPTNQRPYGTRKK